MMRQMRENTKWIMMVTATAFVGLMVFQWGMDITGQGGLTIGEIGSVNGRPVEYDKYNNTYSSLLNQIQVSQEDPITSQQIRDIEDAAWDEVVTQLLIQQELERRGILVTDEELLTAARFSPPPAFQNEPLFLTDGFFDIQKYQAFLASPTIDDVTLFQLEAYYRDVIPRSKLMRQVSSDIYFTDAAVWDEYRNRNEMISVRYLALNPAQRVADSDVAVTAQEVEDYYDDHEEEFALPAQATVRAVIIDKAPTPEDTLAMGELAAELRQEIMDGADFEDILGRPGVGTGSGDLGWFTRGLMPESFSDVAFAATVGEITEPVRTPFGYHLIEVQDQTEDSVQARHIVIPFVRTEESELALYTLADSLEALGESRTIADAALTLTLAVETVYLSTDFALVAGAGLIGEGADWAFEEALVGDVSPVLETRQAFYMLELVELREAGAISLADATGSIEQTVRAAKKVEKAKDEGEEIVAQVRAGADLATIAEEKSLEVQVAGPYARVDFVPGMGRLNAAVGAGFGLNIGDVSGAVAANNNVFIIELNEYFAPDSTVFEAERLLLRDEMLGLAQQTRLQEWLQGLRDVARIIDKRDEVLNTDPVDAQQPFGGFGF
ncbi:MAG: SurA N-terminal domain-containing protein [Gemmatimonadetes bacterium]|nr:SurA N-terminal domain-containing protein [Gemmatimonadota bacterium]